MIDDFTIVLNSYRALAQQHAEIDYGNPESVARGNLAAGRLRAIALDVAAQSQSQVLKFAALVDEDESPAQLWAAHHVAELLPVPEPVLQRAIAVIEIASLRNTVSAVGERMWLKDWYEKRASLHHPRRDDV